MFKSFKFIVFLSALLLYGSHASALGGSCSSPIVFGSGDTLINNTNTTDSVCWFSFTAHSANYRVLVTKDAGYASMSTTTVYAGTCSSLSRLEKIGSTNGTMELEVHGLQSSTVYYIKLSRGTTGTAAQFDILATPITVQACSCISPNACGLICNGSFENYQTGNCPTTVSQLNRACPWDSPNTATPDFFHTCNTTPNTVSVPVNIVGHQSPHTGNGYAGIVVLTTTTASEWHEYLKLQFQSSMVANHTYNVSFWVSLADTCGLAIKGIGAYITSTNINNTANSNAITNTPQILYNSAFITNKTTWLQISGTYTAAGGENYIYIGNFQANASIASTSVTGSDNTLSYYYIDDVSIEDAGNAIAVTPSAPVICNGQSVTLTQTGTAPGTFTWAPATGLSATTGTSVVASPTATTTYTITSSCGLSTTVTVTVNPNPSVTVSSSTTICSGKNTQLTASGALSYSWSPATNLTCSNCSNPYASPTATTTYTVTGTNTYGCSATATVTVTVNPTPSAVITGPQSTCGGASQNYSVPSSANTTYSWSISPTTSFTQSSNTITVNFTSTITQDHWIYCTATNSVTGCSSRDSIFVGACCYIEPGNPNPSNPCFYNVSSSQMQSLTPANWVTVTGTQYKLTNKAFSINGMFTVQGTTIFEGCRVILGYNAQINISPGDTLIITDNQGIVSHLYACSGMWKGITVDGNNSNGNLLIVRNGSTIEDGMAAIHSTNGGQFQVYGNGNSYRVKLNKNYQHIVVDTKPTGTHPGSVKGTDISCKDNVTAYTYSSSPANTLRFPHTGQRSDVGVDITNVNQFNLGDASLSTHLNTYDNMDYGVRSTTSSVTLKNNDFRKIVSTATLVTLSPNCPVGTAICARGNGTILSNRTLVAGGPNTNEPNIFTDCTTGIDAGYQLNVNARYNKFSNVTTGVVVSKNNYKTINVGYNTIKDSKLGVAAVDQRGSSVTISNNSINSSNITGYATGIMCSETVLSQLTHYTVQQNTIDTVRFGITGTLLRKAKIDDNTIRIKHTTSSTAYCRGIYLKSSNSCYVRRNSIYGQNYTDQWVEGIDLTLCSTDSVTCNLTKTLGVGEIYSGTQPFTYMAQNTMYDNNRGLILSQSGVIGVQGSVGNPNDNQWIGTFAQSKTHTYFSYGVFSPFTVLNSSQYYPTSNTRIPNSSPYSIISFTPSATSSSSYNCTTLSPLTHNADTAMALKISQDSIVYATNDTANRWLEDWALYHYLKENSSLTSVRDLGNFMSNNNGSSIDLIYQIQKLLADSNSTADSLTRAYNLNSNITQGENAVTDNWKRVNEILIDNEANGTIPDSDQLAVLEEIANKCPLSDGPAVYIARDLSLLYNANYTEYEDNCEHLPSGEDGRLMKPLSASTFVAFALYPNPSNGEIQLAYSLQEAQSAEMAILDLGGKRIATYPLEAGEKVMHIDNVELNNGVYLYRISVNGMQVKAGKLVIVK